MIQFTNNVGVAPGTTTMTLGTPRAEGLTCLGCPPDPVRYYSRAPAVNAGWPSGVRPPPTAGQMETIYNPYATESHLSGLGEARLGVGLTAMLIGFAGVLGYGWWKRRK